jgi:tetratricopeptide (TPR) repeat protein
MMTPLRESIRGRIHGARSCAGRPLERPSWLAAAWLCATLPLAGCAGLPAGSGAAAGSAPEAGARLLVAEVALDRGQYPVAAREYRLAAAESRDPQVAERAARVAFDAGQDRELELIARDWLKRAPTTEVARRFLAVSLLNQGRAQEAEREFATLVHTAYPGPAEAFTALQQSLGEVRNLPTAALVVGRLAAGYPDVAEAALAHGTLALAAGDSPTAIAEAQRALTLRADLREARWLEVRARIAGGDCPGGLAGSAALAAEAGEGDRLLHAWMLTACDRGAEARPIFDDLARGRLARPEALEGLAGLDVEAGRYDDAVNHYTELLATGRSTDRAFFGLGLVADRKGERDRALRFYTRVTTGPRAGTAQLRAYRLLLDSGDPATAARQLDEYVASNPDARVLTTAGRVQVLSEYGRAREALALADRSLVAYPDQEELRYSRAAVLEKLDRVDEAVRELRGVLRQRPDDAQAMNALGYTLADHGRELPEAERLIRTAHERRPDSAAIQDSLGWVLFRRGRGTEGLEWLKRAYAAEADPEIAAHLGEVQWALGQHEAAERTWRGALEKSPGSRPLIEALGRHVGTPP